MVHSERSSNLRLRHPSLYHYQSSTRPDSPTGQTRASSNQQRNPRDFEKSPVQRHPSTIQRRVKEGQVEFLHDRPRDPRRIQGNPPTNGHKTLRVLRQTPPSQVRFQGNR